MGNWRTVHIVGTCSAEDALYLTAVLTVIETGENYERFHCLMNGGGAGLPMWANERIDAVGNLAERDYTPDSVRRTLEKLAVAAPSLKVKVHCGGDWESRRCISTVTLEAGVASVGPPEVESIPEIPPDQMRRNLEWQMSGRRGPAPQ